MDGYKFKYDECTFPQIACILDGFTFFGINGNISCNLFHSCIGDVPFFLFNYLIHRE